MLPGTEGGSDKLSPLSFLAPARSMAALAFSPQMPGKASGDRKRIAEAVLTLCLELTVIESHNSFFWETTQIKRKRMKQEAVVTSFQYLSLSGKRVELMNR